LAPSPQHAEDRLLTSLGNYRLSKTYQSPTLSKHVAVIE
jgi:hypothetical protein